MWGHSASYSPGPSLPAIPGILEGFSKAPLMAGKLLAKSTVSLPSVEFLSIFPRSKKRPESKPFEVGPTVAEFTLKLKIGSVRWLQG